MNSTDAKAFLIRSILAQAVYDNIALDEFEKKMLEFSEQEVVSENDLRLNEAFSLEHDNARFEAKIAGLIRDLVTRLEREDLRKLTEWQGAIGVLRDEDHYILVLIDLAETQGLSLTVSLGPRPAHDKLKLVLTAAAIVIVLLISMLLLDYFAPR